MAGGFLGTKAQRIFATEGTENAEIFNVFWPLIFTNFSPIKDKNLTADFADFTDFFGQLFGGLGRKFLSMRASAKLRPAITGYAIALFAKTVQNWFDKITPQELKYLDRDNRVDRTPLVIILPV